MNKETGITADIVYLFPPTGDLAKLWSAVPGRKPLPLALAELGYALARSNGRKVYLVDQRGDAQPLRAKVGDGPVDATFAAVDTTTLPTVTEVRAMLRRARREQKSENAAPVRRSENPPLGPKAEPIEPPALPPPASVPPLLPQTRPMRFDHSLRTYLFPSAEPLNIFESVPPASASYVPGPTNYSRSSSDGPTASGPPISAAPPSPSSAPTAPPAPPMTVADQTPPAPDSRLAPSTLWGPDKATEEFLDRWVAEQENPYLNGRWRLRPREGNIPNKGSEP